MSTSKPIQSIFRCDCPVTSALDVVGDKWTLVIIKQILLEGKRTFKDFVESDEAIASNILSSRLKMLEDYHLITKQKLPHNKKTNIYVLSEKGLSLTPIIVELALWSDQELRLVHPALRKDERLTLMKENKDKFVELLISTYSEQNKELTS